jgi:hypothetical protein
MGGLIATRGTQRLIKHFNGLFGKDFDRTRKEIIRNTPLRDTFMNPSAYGALPILDITNYQINGKKIFLPDQSNDHPNLLKRWTYFLGNEFPHDNQEMLRGYLAKALNLQSGENGPTGTNEKGHNYVAIQFDCIQAKPNGAQMVLQSDEYKLKGNNEDDDTGLKKSKAFSLIVLVTEPIKNAPDSLDNQNIQ